MDINFYCGREKERRDSDKAVERKQKEDQELIQNCRERKKDRGVEE